MATLSVVIPTYSRLDLLDRCISSLLNQTASKEMEIVVVDNASPTRISDFIEHRFGCKVRTLRLDRNYFFCGAVNRGASLASGQYLAILNDDSWVEQDWAEEALKTLDESTGIAGVASLVISDVRSGVVDSAGDHMDVTGRATNLSWMEPISSVEQRIVEVFSAAGSCAVYRRDLFDEVGGLDEDFIAYYDDVDLGFRLRLRGYSVVLNPGCRARHVGGATTKTRGRAAFLVERNMVWNLTKNMPADLLQKHRYELFLAHTRPAPLFDGAHTAAWLRGKAASVAGMKKMLAKRRHIQSTRRVSSSALEELMLSHRADRCHL